MIFLSVRAPRFELGLTVLETVVLPLTLRPHLFFCFLVRGVLAAVAAVLFHFQTIFQRFLVLGAEIVGALANRALQLDHVVLRHKVNNN